MSVPLCEWLGVLVKSVKIYAKKRTSEFGNGLIYQIEVEPRRP
ncbi:hypothetical protein Enr17x_60830 [Gimesia fumaroli]|uniref:Uncharacterized protein n=1 Tax=Gimesia fumaroli TaxID=2527976 RepID=A0A518ILM4_9PLAN|nr:hypothetical protein Enr17x_60830 [Gimesia fumaroli]